jgi:formylglycine-generating enzyme required for sulfatase activity
LEVGLHRVQERALGRDLLDRVQHRLVDLLRTGALAPGERAAAGAILAELGDPRFDPGAWHLPAELLLGFVEIPAGPFRMGRDPAVDKNAKEWEQPQHEVTLPTYYIARYPVTVAQFRSFREVSGYQPAAADSLRDPSTRPVCWVNWHEALRYCDWLTETLRAWKKTPEPLATLLRTGTDGGPPWRITLPSEAEWEKAARGNDGRIYPWGDMPDRNAANYRDTGIAATSAVGCFPRGASPYSAEEMSGNVWEWTRSILKGYPYDSSDGRENLEAGDEARVLRGGSWADRADTVGCGVRDGDGPDDWYNNMGFRVVVSPSTSGS